MSISTTEEPLYTYSTCAHLTGLTITINAIFAVSIFAVCTMAYYKMIRYYQLSNNQFSKHVYRAQHLFYIMCILYSLIRMPDIIAECIDPHSFLKSITYVISIVSYYFHWISLLLVLYIRMYHVFKNTDLQLSKCCNIISLIILVGSIPFGIIVLLFTMIYFTFGVLAMASNLLILIIFSQCLAFTFVRKLYQLNKSQASDTNAGSKQDVVVNLMTKYTILAILSFIASTITLFVLIIVSFVFVIYNPEMYLLTLVSQMMDVLVDVIAISLTLKFNDKYYHKMCGKIDKRCKLCCFSVAHGGIHVVQLSHNMAETTAATMPPTHVQTATKEITILTTNSDISKECTNNVDSTTIPI